jgi:hypothetical protein
MTSLIGAASPASNSGLQPTAPAATMRRRG